MNRETDYTIRNLKDEIQEIGDRVNRLEDENYILIRRIAELEAEIGERDAQIAQIKAE